jgi:superfamily I DNA/RNA helicase
MGLNYVGNNNQPIWLKDGIALIKRDNDSHPRKAFDQLSILFTVYELHEEYPSKFNDRLEYFCLKFKTTSENYKVYRQKHQVEISNFIKEFGPNRQASILKVIRNNKKIHFHAKSGTVKISTIHSFKGWESDTLFLIIEKNLVKCS